MRIFAICVVKNEADIIAYNLNQTAKWSDKVFILDNGSTDDTWNIILKEAQKNPKLIPWKSWDVPFYNGLRAEVFNHFLSESQPGDWWCFRADADEFYLDDPRDFLPQVPKKHHYVCKESIEFCLTKEDLEEYQFENRFPEDLPKIKYYAPLSYSEARFFRYRKRFKWDPKDTFPKHMGIVHPQKIRVKHYPTRNIQQLQVRLATRHEAKTAGYMGFNGFKHVQQTHYSELLRHRKDLNLDEGDGNFKIKGSMNQHLHKPPVFLAKRILHGLGILP